MEIKKTYYKEGKEVSKPRSLVLNGKTFVPPTDELLVEAGYEIKEIEIHKVEHTLTYEEKVVGLIREKYTIDQELAIQRQRDSKPEEFAEYNTYCEECKVKAKQKV